MKPETQHIALESRKHFQRYFGHDADRSLTTFSTINMQHVTEQPKIMKDQHMRLTAVKNYK